MADTYDSLTSQLENNKKQLQQMVKEGKVSTPEYSKLYSQTQEINKKRLALYSTKSSSGSSKPQANVMGAIRTGLQQGGLSTGPGKGDYLPIRGSVPASVQQRRDSPAAVEPGGPGQLRMGNDQEAKNFWGSLYDAVMGGAGVADALAKLQFPNAPSYATPDLSGLVAPTAPNFQFQNNDFSQAGQDMASKAFAPQYEILANNRQNMQDQYGRSDQIVAGLYDKLASDIAASAGKTANAYAAIKAQNTANAGELANTTNAAYNDTAATQAALLQKLGIEAAAPQAQAQGRSDQAWALAQGARQAAAQQDYTTNAAQNAADYNQNMSEADRTQGVVSRESLLNQLRQDLYNNDQQKLDVSSQQMLMGNQYANQLGDRDWQLQQASYGAQQDAYSNAWNQYQQQVQNAIQMANMQNAANQGTYQNQVDAYNAQVSNDRYANDSALNWAQFNSDDAYKNAQLQMDLMKMNAASASGSGASSIPAALQSPYEKTMNSMGRLFSGDPQQAAAKANIAFNNLSQLFAQGFNGDGLSTGLYDTAGTGTNRQYENTVIGYQKFHDAAMKMFQQSNPGLSPGEIEAAISAYWANFAGQGQPAN